jgi:hypothetical protein
MILAKGGHADHGLNRVIEAVDCWPGLVCSGILFDYRFIPVIATVVSSEKNEIHLT